MVNCNEQANWPTAELANCWVGQLVIWLKSSEPAKRGIKNSVIKLFSVGMGDITGGWGIVTKAPQLNNYDNLPKSHSIDRTLTGHPWTRIPCFFRQNMFFFVFCSSFRKMSLLNGNGAVQQCLLSTAFGRGFILNIRFGCYYWGT